MQAVLVLEDGTILEGEGFGAEGEVFGEAVFNTSMSGYQEALTDPSYKGQILTLTYPLIGNYGVNRDDFESEKIQVEGFAVRENCHKPSHHASNSTIDRFLSDQGIPGISGIDTRALTIRMRAQGTMKAMLKTSSEKIDTDGLVESVRQSPHITEMDLVHQVTTKELKRRDIGAKLNVAVLDCGMKLGIENSLLQRSVNVMVVPASTPAKDILALGADGMLVTNGPGDPTRADYVIKTIADLKEELPIFGICFGNQLTSLALGAETYKLKFGHRGSNQPVKDLATGRVYITSQNHGFAVDAESLDGTGLEVSHINLNDQTVEGVRHKELPIATVQYHPEANPGPKDSAYLFDEFIKVIEEEKK
ncbi:carbamoyl-phosphate synthase small chain [archaeon BMS3Bbin16]|nr:carbamoyl-phosphate synthase small chain [archaeon BMS3Bbin16]